MIKCLLVCLHSRSRDGTSFHSHQIRFVSLMLYSSLFLRFCLKDNNNIYTKELRMDSVHIGTAMFCQIGSDVCVNFEVKNAL